jgi:hypothetical protein
VNLSFRNWQISTTLLISAWAPPLTSLIVTIAAYAPGWIRRGHPIEIGGLLFTFIGLSIPAAFFFGIIPALLGAVLYCAILTAVPPIRVNIAARAVFGFVCGGVVGGSWCYAILGWDPKLYGIAAAVPAAVLALRWPRPNSKYSTAESPPAELSHE